LNADPQAHMEHLHSSPRIEPQVDGCIECGYCEPSCPSRSLTTTPRQRIALRREMQRQPARSLVLAELLAAYEYDAIQTCAGDASCALSCPIGIDTGSLMKEFRTSSTRAAPSPSRWRSHDTGSSSSDSRAQCYVSDTSPSAPSVAPIRVALRGPAPLSQP